MNQVLDLIAVAQKQFREKMQFMHESGGMTRDRYARFLTTQYHLNKGVQQHFMAIAAHPATFKKRNLRKWLVQFASEEEPHYEIAKADLAELGQILGDIPLEIKLWWLYFDSIIKERPFIRLGATCILENISEGSGDLMDKMIQASGYMNPKNLRYLIIHRHDSNLAHGEQIVTALAGANLSDSEMEDLLEGAKIATILYLRASHWIITNENI